MSQQTIFNFLKNHKRWFTSKELAEKLRITQANVSKGTYKLFKQGLVQKKMRIVKTNKRVYYEKSYYWRIK